LLDLRQHSHAALNKSEASNSVRRAVFFHRQGEIRGRTSAEPRSRQCELIERSCALHVGSGGLRL
jgi:TnpA family transposase